MHRGLSVQGTTPVCQGFLRLPSFIDISQSHAIASRRSASPSEVHHLPSLNLNLGAVSSGSSDCVSGIIWQDTGSCECPILLCISTSCLLLLLSFPPFPNSILGCRRRVPRKCLYHVRCRKLVGRICSARLSDSVDTKSALSNQRSRCGFKNE